jgi:hypothetical protein
MKRNCNRALSLYVSGNKDVASNQAYIKQVFNKAKEYSEELHGRW